MDGPFGLALYAFFEAKGMRRRGFEDAGGLVYSRSLSGIAIQPYV